MAVIDTPEHEKLSKVKDKSQAIGEFIEWLHHEKGISLATTHEHADECYEFDGKTFRSPQCSMAEGSMWSANVDITKLLAEFFHIDLNKIEDEKRAMLDGMRKANK